MRLTVVHKWSPSFGYLRFAAALAEEHFVPLD